MFTIDKIKANISATVLETMTSCRDIKALNNWLTECKEEIERRQELNIDTYPLFYELSLLNMLI